MEADITVEKHQPFTTSVGRAQVMTFDYTPTVCLDTRMIPTLLSILQPTVLLEGFNSSQAATETAIFHYTFLECSLINGTQIYLPLLYRIVLPQVDVPTPNEVQHGMSFLPHNNV
ncbi:hypothetical protein CHS0354_038378, partial [Potamilus streckersoni]